MLFPTPCSAYIHGILLSQFQAGSVILQEQLIYYIWYSSQRKFQLLDNIDGRQARRTNSATPMGLLFDHGCDSMEVMLISLNMCTVTRIGSNYFTILVYLLSSLTFYYPTIEQNYLGGLFLPCLNGVSDGSILIIGQNFLTGIMGTFFI